MAKRTRTKTSTKRKGVNLDPKTDAEALALLRWVYGPQIRSTKDERVEANKKFIDRLTVTR
jgi:hypothetical protein